MLYIMLYAHQEGEQSIKSLLSQFVLLTIVAIINEKFLEIPKAMVWLRARSYIIFKGRFCFSFMEVTPESKDLVAE